MNEEAFSAAMAEASPVSLAGLLSFQSWPDRLADGCAWEQALALRVAREQWGGNNWLPPHWDDWMAFWKDNKPLIKRESLSRPGLVFALLDQMRTMEDRYQPGQMHLPLWLSFVDELVDCGAALDVFDDDGTHCVQALLLSTTLAPYPQIARQWIEKHGVAFPEMKAHDLSFLIGRMLDRSTSMGEDALFVAERAIIAADPLDLSNTVQKWNQRYPDGNTQALLSLAQRIEMEHRTCKATGKLRDRRL